MHMLFDVMIEVLLMLSITCIQTLFYSKTIGLNQKWRGLRLALAIAFVTVVETAIQLVSINISGLVWVGNRWLLLI